MIEDTTDYDVTASGIPISVSVESLYKQMLEYASAGLIDFHSVWGKPSTFVVDGVTYTFDPSVFASPLGINLDASMKDFQYMYNVHPIKKKEACPVMPHEMPLYKTTNMLKKAVRYCVDYPYARVAVIGMSCDHAGDLKNRAWDIVLSDTDMVAAIKFRAIIFTNEARIHFWGKDEPLWAKHQTVEYNTVFIDHACYEADDARDQD